MLYKQEIDTFILVSYLISLVCSISLIHSLKDDLVELILLIVMVISYSTSSYFQGYLVGYYDWLSRAR